MTARRLTLIAAATLLAGSAHAASLTAAQVLQQFNVVALDGFQTSSHVDGRSYVGGNLSGNGAVLSMHPNQLPASSYAGLTVAGSVSGVQVTDGGVYVGGNISNSTVNKGQSVIEGNSSNTSYNGNGVFYVGGAVSGGNLNQTRVSSLTSLQSAYVNAAGSTDLGHVLHGLSYYLGQLPSTGSTVSFSNNNHTVTFNAKADANGVAVFDLTALDTQIFSSTTTDFIFNMNGAQGAVLNTNDKALSLTANFNRTDLGSKIVWNFEGATSVTVNRTFDGQVLAVDGTFSNLGGANVEGGVYAKNILSAGEIHQQSLAAPIPEPETYAMLLAGLGMVGVIARRRQRAAAR